MTLGHMITIARPYAIAAFERALEKNDLSAWEALLNSAALIVNDNQVQSLLNNPHIRKQQFIDLFCDVLAPLVDTEKKNFLCLLADYKRLPVLPDVARLFVHYLAEYKKNMQVEVVSAVVLDQSYQQKLILNLTKRLQRNVSLQCSVDPTLLGGVIVRAGDTVIDGSVRGKLNRLLESL